VVTGIAEQDAAVRALIVALARQGVTATLGRHDRSRYGTLDIDSNMPDVRISVGRPSESRFTAGVLRAAGAAYSDELERQLSGRGWARLWVPAAKPLDETWSPTADVRGYAELPCLVVAGSDLRATISAIEALVADLSDAVVSVEQPAGLDGSTGAVEDYTIAILNRGVPSFNVESDGSMYLSVMRSCSGWPSGVWINPPRRTAPDGSNFQFQHWSHTFEYALVGSTGDWRAARAVQAGHEFNNPLLACVLDAHSGDLPAATSFASVEPATAVMTVLKPAGEPLSRMAGPDQDPAAGITMRLYESSGAATKARVSFFAPLRDAAASDVLEATHQPLTAIDGGFTADLGPYAIATLTAVPQVAAPEPGARTTSDDGTGAVELAPRTEPAQPVYSDYWMHNKGPAPAGYVPLAVQIAPGRVAGKGPFSLPVSVASERTDAPLAGAVSLLVPDGWTAEPHERLYRLAPGAHLAFEASVTPPASAPAGRYFVAARVTDESGQVHEDVVTIDLDPAATREDDPDVSVRSPSLSVAIERAMRLTGLHAESAQPEPAEQLGGELEAELSATELVVAPGQPAELRVRLRNTVAGEIRGEAQIISPHETWPLITPWTQGFSVTAGAETTVFFTIVAPLGFRGGEYWALVKLMYFGRLLYTESVRIEVRPA
jgi:hypothetical protein